MRKLLIVASALLLSGCVATPYVNAASLSLFGGWTVQPSLSEFENPLTAVNRDVLNGMWEIGPGFELLPFHNKSADGVDREVFFIGAFNTYVLGDNQGQGVFGANLGVHMPTAILQIYQFIASKPDLISQLPAWVQKINKYTSLDFGYGNRIFGVPKAMAAQGIKANSYGFGVFTAIPIGDLFNVNGSL